MCLGIPGEIVEIRADESDLARVDVAGVRRMVNIGLLEGQPLIAGDWVLIHVGFALSKIDEQEARAAMDFLQSIGQAYEDEIRALTESRIG
jgi:hydrogenase expression/formation protein HypC